MIMVSLGVVSSHRFKNGCLHSGRSAKPTEDTRQSKHQLTFYGRFSVIVGSHRGFEGLVILCILEHINDGLGGEAVMHSIAPRTRFAFRRRWPGAFECVTTIGFNLLERAH